MNFLFNRVNFFILLIKKMKALVKAHHLLYNESKNQLSRKVKKHNKGSEGEKKTKLKKKHTYLL